MLGLACAALQAPFPTARVALWHSRELKNRERTPMVVALNGRTDMVGPNGGDRWTENERGSHMVLPPDTALMHLTPGQICKNSGSIRSTTLSPKHPP